MLQHIQFSHVSFHCLCLPRIFARYPCIILFQHHGHHMLRIIFLVLPVIQQIVVRQQHVHVRGILCHLIDICDFLFSRMQRTEKFFFLILQFIQTGQQNDQECHVIIQQHLPFDPTALTQCLTQSTVVRLIIFSVFLRKFFSIHINISKHDHTPCILIFLFAFYPAFSSSILPFVSQHSI